MAETLRGTAKWFSEVSKVFEKFASDAEITDKDIRSLQPVATKKRIKDPNEPKKPLSTYFLFLNDLRTELKSIQPDLPQTEFRKLVAERWKNMDEHTRQVLFCSYVFSCSLAELLLRTEVRSKISRPNRRLSAAETRIRKRQVRHAFLFSGH